MKIPSFLLLLMACATHALFSQERVLELEEAVENLADDVDMVDISDLGIDWDDERETGVFCNFILGMFSDQLDQVGEVLGFNFTCTCGLGFSLTARKATVNFKCGTEVCTDYFEQFIPDAFTPLPLSDDLCLSPSYGGSLYFGLRDFFSLINDPSELFQEADFTSQVCTGGDSATVDLDALEALLDTGDLFDDDSVSFSIADLCVTIDHNLEEFSGCAVTVGETSCPCDVCGDYAVQLDCADLFEPFIPDLLNIRSDLMLKDRILSGTETCFGVRTVNAAGVPVEPLINPLLEIPN